MLILTDEEIERVVLSLCFPKGVPPPSEPISLEELCERLRASYEGWYSSLPKAKRLRLERRKRLEEERRHARGELTILRNTLPKIERTIYEKLIERCVKYEYGTCGTPINIICLKTNLTPYKVKEIISRLCLKRPPDPYPSNCSYKLIRDWVKNYPKGGTSIAEKHLLRMLDKYFPHQWKYVGDRKMYIGGLCPDFVSKRQKLVIELFGDWHHFHLPKKSNPNLTKEKAETERRDYFRQYGFNTLVIWASELNKEPAVIRKIENFMEGTKCPADNR